jgi:anti-sigma factor RsiW
MDCNEARTLLSPSIDRELDIQTEAALAAHIDSCAACAAQRQQCLGIVADIRAGATCYRAPEALRGRVAALLPAPPATAAGETNRGGIGGVSLTKSIWFVLNGGGMIAAACVGFVLLLMLPRESTINELIADEALANHARALLANHVMDIASSDQHTVKPWFSARLDFSPPVRDLSAQGFPLVGGRLDYLDRHPVAVLVYRHRQHQIEVFVWPSKEGSASTTVQSSQGYHIVGSTASGMRLLAVSDIDAAELQRLTDLLQE